MSYPARRLRFHSKFGRRETALKQNLVNHIGFVLDKSSSMGPHARDLIKVVDNLVAHLGTRSKELDQETRVSIWVFADSTECVVWDMDVLRLPSIASLYSPHGNTALIDATLLACADLGLVPEKYGDHAFLLYAFTDGENNRGTDRAPTLTSRLQALPNNWTVAAMVPNMSGKFEAKKFGFPADNIAIWDTTSAQGVEEAGVAMAAATDNYMVGRASGIRTTTGLFNASATAVNKQTIAASGLKPLDMAKYVLIPVPPKENKKEIREFVKDCGINYVVGRAYYQLSKPEKVQPQKLVAVVGKKDGKVYVGREARDLVGLPDTEVRIRPDFNPEFEIYIQSTSVNRHVMVGTKILYLH